MGTKRVIALAATVLAGLVGVLLVLAFGWFGFLRYASTRPGFHLHVNLSSAQAEMADVWRSFDRMLESGEQLPFAVQTGSTGLVEVPDDPRIVIRSGDGRLADPFQRDRSHYRVAWLPREEWWVVSPGPDHALDLNPSVLERWSGLNDAQLQRAVTNRTYDSTNGAVSEGDLFRGGGRPWPNGGARK